MVRESNETFAAFFRQMRVEKDTHLKPIADRMGVSVAYLSDIGKGRRMPPDPDRVEAMADTMGLSEEERWKLYDLAGKERGEVAADLTKYIMDSENPTIRTVLRCAQKNNLGESFWQEVNQLITQKTRNRVSEVVEFPKEPEIQK